MERLAIVARLKERAESEAAELLAGGAPFGPEEGGLERHTVWDREPVLPITVRV